MNAQSKETSYTTSSLSWGQCTVVTGYGPHDEGRWFSVRLRALADCEAHPALYPGCNRGFPGDKAINAW